MKIKSILTGFLILMIFISFSAKRIVTIESKAIKRNDYMISDGLFLKPTYPPFTIRAIVLGVITTVEIKDLALCESTTNPEAENLKDIHYNDDGTISVGSFGVLQFSKPTFQEFCVEKYRLTDDLFCPEIQIICAEKMISEGYGDRWACYK